MKDTNIYRTRIWKHDKGTTYYHFIQLNYTTRPEYDHRPLKEYEYDDAVKYMDGHNLYEMDQYCQKLWAKHDRKNKIKKILL